MSGGSLLLALVPILVRAQSADFVKEVAPVLETHCLACHNAEKNYGGLRVDNPSGLGKAVIPGQPYKSSLFSSMRLGATSRGAMPPAGPRVPEPQQEIIRRWIAAGAPWPASVTLPIARSAKPDERYLVDQLHRRILAFAKENTSAAMKAYRASIPGTTVGFEMVPIPAGEFLMGTPESERGRNPDEGPRRRVRLDTFWMGKHEVTWDEYRLFMFSQQAGEAPGADPVVDAVSRPTRPYVEMSFGMGINGYPAISMTQHAASKYAQWLSARTGRFYRLPTEAEWEYACRAGSETAYSFGDNPSALSEYAWTAANSNGKYERIGTKKPNRWELHDMHGNVFEWTLDAYAASYPIVDGPALMPWVRSTKPYPHAVRGGSWNDEAASCRCGARLGSDPSWKMQDPQLPKSIWYHTDAQWLGFRIVRPLKIPSAAEMYAYWNSGVEKD
jgi:formylglycine-generating enzyme required for sulfatase activity